MPYALFLAAVGIALVVVLGAAAGGLPKRRRLVIASNGQIYHVTPLPDDRARVEWWYDYAPAILHTYGVKGIEDVSVVPGTNLRDDLLAAESTKMTSMVYQHPELFGIPRTKEN